MDDDVQKQFETMAAIRAYAKKIAEMPIDDVRPSTAFRYRKSIVRMMKLQEGLDCVS